MTTRKKYRLERVARAIGSMPVRADLLDRTFENFRETGELPDEQQLAWAVCERALGSEARPRRPSRLEILIMQTSEGPNWVPPTEPEILSVRHYLFDEAVYGPPGVIRHAARVALKMLVDFGADVTDPGFLADKTLPKRGSVGLHLMGFPERLAKRPYVAQAKRLFARFDAVCDRIDQDDPMWGATLEAAVAVLNACGDLPGDDRWRDVVLAILELNALIWHRRGEDVRGLMAALDAAARLAGDEREVAIGKVQELVRAERYGG